MNQLALKKHKIYNNLSKLDEKGINSLADYLDFLMTKEKKGQGKIVKLKGILSKYKIDFSYLKKFKEDSWKHVEKEIDNE